MSSPADVSDSFPRRFGKYHLLAPLAQGGMGALYLATSGERGLERLLVIKTVLPHLADDEYLARFRDEAKVVVKLSHGNLIPVFDAGQVDGELFIAMDFVEGKDLRAVWNRCAKKAVAFPVEVAVHVVKELCRGLDYAHSYEGLDLVHRDVSPPNVLLSYSGEVRLTDFGLASSSLKLEKTAPGIVYGKVAYMSPEQARGEKLDGASDLYAAGIILWELLTGRQLFPPGKEQPQELIKRARNPLVQPPSQRAPRVPKALDDIVLKALAAAPAERYESCDAFREALNGWLAENSPATDASTIEAFLVRLFAEDIARARAERASLIEKTRQRVQTLPPSDELRKLFEEGDPEKLRAVADRRRGEGPNLGRRSIDRGESEQDRRRRLGRRMVDKTVRGVAIDVPKPGPEGRTVVPRAKTAGHGALAEADSEPLSQSFIGQVVDGRYAISELIGEGGMGRVYLAEHVEIGKRVAVKILHPVYGRMPELVERFRREARAASKIGHPNIVDVTDSGTTNDGSVYFVMEYLEGAELAHVIDREGALDLKRALRIASQICRALSAAHTAGIIHRDLKPENVFLTVREGSSDFVKVLDFGIAKSTEAEEARTKKLTHPGMAMGTPEYMAPEQAAGKQADERCDVYAVGAILYEMITGAAPYEGENFMEILTKKATVDPVPPGELRADVPDSVESLIIAAMARNPDERPPSMEAFEYELTKCLSGRGAAVAGLLGMRADSALAEKVHRGKLGRDDSAEVRGESSAPRPRPRPSSSAPPPARTEEWAENTAIVEEPGAVPDVSGGSFRVLGYVLLGLIVVFGAGIVLFVASGEKRSAAVQVTDAGEAAAATVDTEDPETAEPQKRQPKRRGGGGGGRDKKADDKPPRSDGLPSSAEEAEALLEEARGHVARLEWPQARAKYQKVIAGKFMANKGYLGLAEVAFQTKNHDDAIRHARRAGNSVEALMLLGHSHFRKEEYAQAVKYYERVLRTNPGHKEALKTVRAAREKLE